MKLSSAFSLFVCVCIAFKKYMYIVRSFVSMAGEKEKEPPHTAIIALCLSLFFNANLQKLSVFRHGTNNGGTQFRVAIGRLLLNCSYNRLDANPWLKFGRSSNYNRRDQQLICAQLLLNRMIFLGDCTDYLNLNRALMTTDMNMSIAVQLNVGWSNRRRYSNAESVNNYTYRYFTNGQTKNLQIIFWLVGLFVLNCCFLQSQIGKLVSVFMWQMQIILKVCVCVQCIFILCIFFGN